MRKGRAMSLSFQDDRLSTILASNLIKNDPLAELGFLEIYKPQESLRVRRELEQFIETTLGVSVIYFEDIFIPDGSRNGSYRLSFPSNYDLGTSNRRLRITRTSLKKIFFGTRAEIREYLYEDGVLPEKATSVLEKIQAWRLPLSMNVMVWVPWQGRFEAKTMLVIEFSKQLCIPIMEW